MYTVYVGISFLQSTCIMITGIFIQRPMTVKDKKEYVKISDEEFLVSVGKTQ